MPHFEFITLQNKSIPCSVATYLLIVKIKEATCNPLSPPHKFITVIKKMTECRAKRFFNVFISAHIKSSTGHQKSPCRAA